MANIPSRTEINKIVDDLGRDIAKKLMELVRKLPPEYNHGGIATQAIFKVLVNCIAQHPEKQKVAEIVARDLQKSIELCQ